MDFLSYIGAHYSELKKLLQQYKDFNEDVFHNTIISCSKIDKERNLQFKTDNDIVRYFVSSYRTNILREHNYYYNKNVKASDDITISNDKLMIYNKLDIQIILDKIKKKYPENLYNAFYRYITEGISIAKLQEETNIKNLKQKLKEIKEFVKNQVI